MNTTIYEVLNDLVTYSVPPPKKNVRDRSLYYRAFMNANKLLAEKHIEDNKQKVIEDTFSPATLVLLSMYHSQYNIGITIADIDKLIELAQSFEKELNDSTRDWEESEIDWENAIIQHYNKHKESRWEAIS